MTQTWHDLLFAHWPLPAETVRAAVPAELELDTVGGSAWLGVVPFRMTGIRLRGLPPIPGTAAFPELNMRTYVRRGGRAGVWFFSLDAANALAVAAARRWFHLPYFRARMTCDPAGEGVRYESVRTHRGAAPAELRAEYGPASAVDLAPRGSLEHWLTERYCLYAVTKNGNVLRGDIHHRPWPLQRAKAQLERCTLPAAHGFALPQTPPHLLFARRLEVLIWPPRRDDGNSVQTTGRAIGRARGGGRGPVTDPQPGGGHDSRGE